MSTPPVRARLDALLARKAPVAVLFRRGPSQWVQLITWNTRDDQFEAGQWFHGRVYERRCDLSPDGTKLIYFASKFTGATMNDREYTFAWTAISKPPYWTALALWPKGDCWHGGGLFTSARDVWLNHRPAQATPHPDHRPRGLRVTPNEDAYGEDWPVWSRRMERDGWCLAQAGQYDLQRGGGWETKRIETWKKASPDGETTLRYQLMSIDFKEPGGPYHVVYSVKQTDMPQWTLPSARWADWDQQGRLVWTSEGRVYAGRIEDNAWTSTMLADLNDNQPEQIPSPEWARSW